MNTKTSRSKLHTILRAMLGIAVALTATATTSAVAAGRATYDLNLDWRLLVGDPAGASAKKFDDSQWKLVTLPHAWNEDSAFAVSIDNLPTGIAWYRKHFTLDAAQLKDAKVFIEFEGVRMAAEVYVNGKPAGLSENGVMAFGFDITPNVVAGDNTIAVRTDNSWTYHEKATKSPFQWNDRNFYANYGGIAKNVRLHITGKLYQTLPLYSNLGTTGVYVYATDFDIPNHAATIHAESQVRNETGKPQTFQYRVSMQKAGVSLATPALDNEGRAVSPKPPETWEKARGGFGETALPETILTVPAGKTATVSTSALISNLDFWSWGHGALYDVTTTLLIDGKPVDAVTTRTGFRKTEFANGMITLNDRVIQMHGHAQRTTNEWPAIGLSVTPWLSDYSNGLMVAGNGNLVRWMHVTPWKQDVESCDRVGLIENMPAGDSEKDVTGRRWEQRTEVMRDAIIYNRNNPSILFYECGNNGISEEHMAEMKAIRDKYDPRGGRAIGSRASESRAMITSPSAEYSGEMLYINKSARTPVWAMEYERDEGLRKYWDEFTPPFHKNGDGPPYRGGSSFEYNRNQDSLAIENVARWFDYWRERPGTGTRVSSGGTKIIFSDSNTHHRGSENYRTSGVVDAMRIPKDAFYADQAMWDGWVDVEHPRTHIIGHWNYAPGTVKNVCVVSSADEVELFINNKSLGLGKQTDRFLYTFENVAWQPGELRAVGRANRPGGPSPTDTLQTAGAPASLRLTSITPTTLRADGHDLALVEVEVVDANGHRCPTALDTIDFAITGPAEWRGGLAQGRDDNYTLSKQLPVACGVNRVLIRSTRDAGTITLTAKSGSLTPATLTFATTPVTTQNGLLPLAPAPANTAIVAAAATARIPSSALQPFGPSAISLRGPTPTTPSYKITRTPVEVASATAGSNAADAAKSYDDDESTTWSSAGPISNAWIEYTLARPAVLDEVVIKLTGWRQRSYPIRITMDGKEIYKGSTPKNLGYATLKMNPAPAGTHVRVELAGESKMQNVSTSTEVANDENASTGANTVGKAALSILEIEFYEALK